MDIKQKLQGMTAENILNLSVSDVAALFLQSATEIARLEGWCANLVAQAVNSREAELSYLQCIRRFNASLIQLMETSTDELTVVHLNAFKHDIERRKNEDSQSVTGEGSPLHGGETNVPSAAPDGEPGHAVAARSCSRPSSGPGGGRSREEKKGSGVAGAGRSGVDPQDERRFLAGDADR
jgi:hypothetical protein